MSKLNEVIQEAKTKLIGLNTPPITLVNKVVVSDSVEDLVDALKGIKTYPAVGVVYEGMRSMPESGPTARMGISGEIVLAFILLEYGQEIHATDQKRTRAIDYLDGMRDQFMGKRSTVTQHYWHFLVEAPAEIKTGMVVWVQRWSLPVQLPPKQFASLASP